MAHVFGVNWIVCAPTFETFLGHLSLWKGIWNVSRIRGLALTFPKWCEKVKSDEKWQINVALKISWSQEKLARERARADDDYKDFQEDLLELMIISLEISFFKKCGVPPTCAPQFLKNSSWAQGLEKKPFFERVKPPKILPTFFCGLLIHIKNTFCKKNGSKRPFQPSAVVRAIYTRLYGVPAAN